MLAAGSTSAPRRARRRRRCCSSSRRCCATASSAASPRVLIIDEAQMSPARPARGDPPAGQYRNHDTKLLSVVLAGQPELGDPPERQLAAAAEAARRAPLRAPTALDDRNARLCGRPHRRGRRCRRRDFHARGGHADPRARGGIPRTISVIADNALVAGFALDAAQSVRQVVEEVCRDLDLSEASGQGGVRSSHRAAKAPAAVQAAAPTRVLTFDVPGSEQPGSNRPVADRSRSRTSDGQRHRKTRGSRGEHRTVQPDIPQTPSSYFEAPPLLEATRFRGHEPTMSRIDEALRRAARTARSGT